MYIVALVGIIVGIIGVDCLVKTWAYNVLQNMSDPIQIIPGVIRLNYVENPGAAFGMLANHRWVFILFSSIAIVGLIVYLFKFSPKSKWLRVSIAFIVGGGIGNMIDRIALGKVVDMIDFYLINFAVFNVADSFITVGSCMLALYLIKDIINESKKSKNNGEQNP